MERSTATASLSSFIMPNLMILALARWVLWRAPLDDISLNLHKVMKAGNGRTKQFTCWHGKKWFANKGGERKSRQRSGAGEEKRSKGSGGREGERERGGSMEEWKKGKWRMELTGRGAAEGSAFDDDDGFSEATVNSCCLPPSQKHTHGHAQHTNICAIRGRNWPQIWRVCWQDPCFAPPFHPNCNHLLESHLCSRDEQLQHHSVAATDI